MQVNRVTIHHEGAGKPRDQFGFLAAGYSGGVGLTRYELVRSPHESFTTRGQGGVRSLQVCFSGDRRFFMVTDDDIRLVRQLVDDARARGWVSDYPEVFLHGDTDLTECPGTWVKSCRGDLWAACQKAGLPEPAVQPVPTTSGGVLVTLKAKMATVPLAHVGFGCFEGHYDAGAPVKECVATVHGPSPTHDGWWDWSLDAVVRCQARGNKVIVTAFCPRWSPGAPNPAVHVLAAI